MAGHEGDESSHGSVGGRWTDGDGERRPQHEHRRHRDDHHDRPQFDMHRFLHMGLGPLVGGEYSEVASDWLEAWRIVFAHSVH